MPNFPSLLAQDSNGNVAAGVSGQVFATTDLTASTPLAITDLSGIAYSGNTLTASSLGVLPPFIVQGETVVSWVSGNYRMDIPSLEQIPRGGAAGQVLVKASIADYDYQWLDFAQGVPAGGTDGQVLVKDGPTDYSARWITPTAGGTSGSGEGYCSVMAYGAKRDNVTDDLDAFNKAQDAAILAGHRTIYAPGGLGPYRIRSQFMIKSGVTLYGSGIDRTIIKLADNAAFENAVIINADLLAGNTFVRVRDMTLDGNVSRTVSGVTYTSTSGARSSCLTFGNVQFGWINNIKAINAGKHGIDITHGSLDYSYPGDMPQDTTPRPSRWIWVDGCQETNFGDDGLTTHHSEYLFLSNNYGYNSRNTNNSNAVEIDDGSRHVFMHTMASSGCYAGLEIKAHDNSPAAQDVHIDGYISTGDVRSFNWRHIGHHTDPDPVSLSAYDITATNLVSINPNNDRGFQGDISPRALCISAYRRVSVTNLTIIGRRDYLAGDMAVSLQYRAGYITLSNINITGWTGAAQDISVTSGDNVSISGVNIMDSAQRAIYTGSGATDVQLSGINATGPSDPTKALYGIDFYHQANNQATGLSISNYPVAVRSDGINWPSADLYMKRVDKQVPTGVTRLADLEPSRDYYFSTTDYATMTDIPAGSSGGNWILHSAVTENSAIQTITRNTFGTTSQTRQWRVINYTDKTAGPWNNSIPAVGGGVATSGGSVQFVRKSGTTWPARPTSDPAVLVLWIGADPSPQIVTSGTAGMRDGVDIRMVTP